MGMMLKCYNMICSLHKIGSTDIGTLSLIDLISEINKIISTDNDTLNLISIEYWNKDISTSSSKECYDMQIDKIVTDYKNASLQFTGWMTKYRYTLYAIFIWVNDDPVEGNVLKLSNITEPRLDFSKYTEGQKVKAKCPNFGIVDAVLSKIAEYIGDMSVDIVFTNGVLADNYEKMQQMLKIVALMEDLIVENVESDYEEESGEEYIEDL
ncbi:Hypothetical predicted protein [Mytilus galloprovincialis]|uniref:Uncharacterized protein n=1 Tax=Mytilus galloprovincialis TaxID=29158 RepID=A0A8B6EHC3_MYTGA|nr:Hypothetical predicted protein [Mytilus galloprovincialis]